MKTKQGGLDGAGASWPEIQGEIDDIKALEFAHALCAMVADFKSGWGGIHADAERAAASLKTLIETSKGFESSAIERQDFLETMLRKDGLAVVIYLEASEVRETIRGQGFDELAEILSTEAITSQFQNILHSDDPFPPGLAAWTTAMETAVAESLIKAHVEKEP